MPERSFGRTVRYRRTKVGMSQAKLADLVGRSTATIRSWERDQSRPNDPQILTTLAAILDLDERLLFDKADVERPEIETSPTVEQALATLSKRNHEAGFTPETSVDLEPDPTPLPVSVGDYTYDFDQHFDDWDEPAATQADRLIGVGARPPAYTAPPEPYQQIPLTPSPVDVSYVEDASQRQLYRVRNLATLVAVVALVIAFVWAWGEGLGALGSWWDSFFGNLRL